jgi:integrase
MRPPLTQLAVDRLKPPAKGYTWHPDSKVGSGFGLRCYHTGRKAYGINRRWADAAQPSFKKLGDHPVLTLVQARALARKVLADPDAAGPSLASNSRRHARRSLVGITTAMRTRSAGSRFYSWLLANDLADRNPFTHTEPYAIPPRSRVLTDGELATLWAATDSDRDLDLIVRLLLWTGARRTEIGGMRWSELQGDTWRLPAERSKNHMALTLPLPRQALEALARWPRIVGRDPVFGTGPDGLSGWSFATARLRKQVGIERPWSLHDCRRTVETRLAALGTPRDIIGRLLNHGRSAIEKTYDLYDYRQPMQAALQAWADELDQIVARGSAEVIAIRP